MRAGCSFPHHPLNSQNVPEEHSVGYPDNSVGYLDKSVAYLKMMVYVIQEERPPHTKEPPNSTQGTCLTRENFLPHPWVFSELTRTVFPSVFTQDYRNSDAPSPAVGSITCLSSGRLVPRSYAEDGGDNESRRLFFSLLWLCRSGSRSLLRTGFLGVGV